MNSREVRDLLEQLDDIRGSLRNLERLEDLIESMDRLTGVLGRSFAGLREDLKHENSESQE